MTDAGRTPAPRALATAIACLMMLCASDTVATSAESSDRQPGDRRVPPLRLAQAQTPQTPPASAQLVVEGVVKAKPGQRVPLPIRIDARAANDSNHIMIYKTPVWLSVTESETVGSGVWVIGPATVSKAQLVLADSASGRHEMLVSLLSRSGQPVAEQRLVIEVEAAQTTAGAAAPVEAPAAAPSGARTWASLVPGGAPAKGAPPPATAPAPSARVPAAAAQGAQSEAQLVAHARHLVRECTTCHSLYGQDVGIPLMIGINPDRFMDTMRLYKTGKRDNQAMRSVAEMLNDAETRALALYLGRIKPPANNDPPPVTAAARQSVEVAPARRQDPQAAERIGRYISRGSKMLESGEIAQARLLFERAAESGSPQAAFLLASSYDPNALPWRPGMGLAAEPLRAREWYLIAKKLGAGAEVEQRLADLPAPR